MRKRDVAPFDGEAATRAVVAVRPNGANGRGFVMDIPVATGERNSFVRRIVVTAAHCLPKRPPCQSSEPERTYPDVVSPLGTSEPSLMAECMFVDPVADIAVLGAPDHQIFSDAFLAYEEFIRTIDALSLNLNTRPMIKPVTGWLLSLDGHWTRCRITELPNIQSPGGLWIAEASAGIEGGMSGSPILLDDGRVIGVVCTSGGREDEMHTDGGPQPKLMNHLPGWLVRRL